MFSKRHYQAIAETIGRVGNLLSDESLVTIANEFDIDFRRDNSNYKSHLFFSEVEKQVNKNRDAAGRIGGTFIISEYYSGAVKY